ncbi:ABC transporter substrate-binding protein [Rhodobacter ferrooxidans]|uniref:Extracellular solute-binding protein family 5 n=1 Tax=Rhodobacter ferrooxidans TaxID=371731 RepID=C8RZ86_9RHOB|nr:ABC transporter substrate-binding protein [Rhodobacter sp. SW2]EEW26043.1 extracellular solute-binding protein family 5 [Rhodobacter sp. SW2]
MRLFPRLMAAAAIAVLPLATPMTSFAETPADTLIQAWAIDDIISLDPAEVFEISTTEILGNTYEPIIGYDIADVSKLFGVVADSWTMSADGLTMSFTVKQGKKFASGNDLTAEDVVWSLVRAVKLDKSPAFILGQFGLTPDNVEANVKQTGDYSFDLTMDKAYAPTFLLYCLTSSVAMVVDKDLVMANEVDGDFGYNWLKTNYAGSGAFTIREWRANESVVLERNPNYSGPAPTMARNIYRHIPEAATQRLLLEKGDIDVARNLLPEEITALSTNPDVAIQSGPKGTIFYISLNQKNEFLAKPEVREAMKWLVDYQAIADTIVKGQYTVHQTFLPAGFLGALDENPYSLNVEKAKELLAAAGLPDGFTVTMDTRNSPQVTAIAQAVQATMAQAGIKIEIIPGDGGQTLEKYRARTHDLYIGVWGPDYQDPHTNATFARNPDNADTATAKTLAWRNAWDIPDLTARADAAVLEADAEKRAATYRELQQEVLATSPFVVMFQQTEVAAVRANVKGYIIGPSFGDNSFRAVTK